MRRLSNQIKLTKNYLITLIYLQANNDKNLQYNSQAGPNVKIRSMVGHRVLYWTQSKAFAHRRGTLETSMTVCKRTFTMKAEVAFGWNHPIPIIAVLQHSS